MKKRTLPLIIGNWKTFPTTLKEAVAFVKMVDKKVALKKAIRAGYYLAVPDVFISTLLPLAKKGSIGSQNISGTDLGAHTGLQTLSMYQSIGTQFTIIGHSEVRARGEGDDVVAKKVLASLSKKMMTVLCVGEEKRDLEGGYLGFIEKELKENLSLVDRSLFSNLVIAYEPIWAIGKSVSATPAECFEAVIAIRRTLALLAGIDYAKKVAILYGGSVSKDNALMFLQEGGVDGLLIGHASTNPKDFITILEQASTI